MDATIDIKSLEEAVTVFYRSGAQQQSNAHDWLTKAQMSPQAWSFVWDLMQLGKVNSKEKKPSNFIGLNENSFVFPFVTVIGNSILWCNNIAYETIEALA